MSHDWRDEVNGEREGELSSSFSSLELLPLPRLPFVSSLTTIVTTTTTTNTSPKLSLSSSVDSLSDSSQGGSAEAPSEILSIVQALGYTTGSCGYCATNPKSKVKKSGRSYGCWAHIMSCQTYKTLIDHGWRRSGKYLYKPDMRATCCPQFTISLDAAAFSPSKSQRQLLHRFSNFLVDGGREGKPGWGPQPVDAPSQAGESGGGPTTSESKPDSLLTTAKSVTFNPSANPTIATDEDNTEFVDSGSKGKRKQVADEIESARGTASPAAADAAAAQRKEKTKAKGKGKATPADLSELVHEGEWQHSSAERPFKHRFEFKLEESSFTEEKFRLFFLYQTQIHNEPEAKVTRKGFRRFLVDSPLETEHIHNSSYNYGSQHGLYYLDGKLIALAVLDVLPGAVSSVYFAWDPAWSALGLGKISALREAAMVREMKQDGVEGMDSYMMGYYIHTCVKMKYKGDYQPSYLLDPETNVFYPFDQCKAQLDLDPHASFSRPRSVTATQPIAIPSPSLPHSTTSPEAALTPLAPIPSDQPSSTTEAQSSDGEDDSEFDTEDNEEDDEVAWPDPPPPGCLDPSELPKSLLLNTCVLEGRNLVPLLLSAAWHDEEHEVEVRQLLAAMGEEVKGKIAVWVG